MKGEQKGKGLIGGIFPHAGVPEQNIREAAKFGEVIRGAFRIGHLDKLQGQLLEKGAVKVKPVLVSIEKRGRMMFGFWSKFVLKREVMEILRGKDYRSAPEGLSFN